EYEGSAHRSVISVWALVLRARATRRRCGVGGVTLGASQSHSATVTRTDAGPTKLARRRLFRWSCPKVFGSEAYTWAAFTVVFSARTLECTASATRSM